MTGADVPLRRVFRGLLAARYPIIAIYAVCLPIAIALALRVPSDNAIDRLIVATDPDYRATREFQEVFPETRHVVLIAEATDPFAPAVLEKVAAVERRLAGVPGVRPISALDLYRRVRPDLAFDAGAASRFRNFATGSTMLRRQGLVGEGFLGIVLALDAADADARNTVLAGIEAVLAAVDLSPAPLTGVRRVGRDYVDAHLERETSRATARYFPLFGLFVVVLNIALYRSWRALAAFLLTLAVSVALSIGAAALVGWSFTIVSSLVPLTVLVTTTATLVYLHSRYVEQPPDTPLDEHHVAALANKFVPCTASVFAAIVGFAALSVSSIRPIYEMGLWTATGLAVAWVVCFTLFPALQKTLRTPTQQERRVAVRWFPALVDRIVPLSYRWRWVLVPLATVSMVGGAVALFGIPGLVDAMRLETDALDYMDKGSPVYVDTRRFEKAVGGLSVTDIWIRTEPGAVLDPGFLRGVERLSRLLEADARVGSVTGPTTVLRWMRYVGSGDDRLPDDPAAWPKLAADLEHLLLTEPDLRRFVDVSTLAGVRLTMIARGEAFEGHASLTRFVEEHWTEALRRESVLGRAEARLVGDGVLQAKIAHFLVPTLVESFVLTAGVIFIAFLVVFRSGVARVMALIPSVFAILTMFLVMRATGIPLNVATILIASTVLGASENDQIHFFYHFQEMRRVGSTERALRHALLVAGRAILFATLINAGGFLALAFSPLPPMRQFGIVASSAFALAMLADFTALPAALWILFRDKPDALRADPR